MSYNSFLENLRGVGVERGFDVPIRQEDVDNRTLKQLRDPTDSFDEFEFAALSVISDIPPEFWQKIDSGVDQVELRFWKNKLDKIKPGMGEYFLGSIGVSEEDWLARYNGTNGIPRAPVNYHQGARKFGDRLRGFYDTYEDWLRANGYSVEKISAHIKGETYIPPKKDIDNELKLLEAKKQMEEANYQAERARLQYEKLMMEVSS